VSAENEVANSASGGSDESVDIPLGDGDAGEWWILVQNWDASTPGGTDTVDLEHVVVSGDEGNLRAEGPASQPAGEPFTIRAFWDEEEMDAGETWYGSLTLDAAPGGTEIGTIPVTVNRLQDDVTKEVDVESAAPGDTVTYTVEVQPNVTPEDLTYTFEDTLPEGTTYVEGSGPEGATVDDGVLTWETTMPTGVGVQGDYDITTSADDDSCVNPLTGDASYFDVHQIDDFRDADVFGDGTAWTFAQGTELGFFGDTYPGMSFTDDGFLVYGVDDNYGGDPATPQTLPDAALPNNLAAFLWQDMQIVYDAGSQAGASLVSLDEGAGALVQLDDLRQADDPTGAEGLYDVQAMQFEDDPTIYVAYGPTSGPLTNVTIGAENATGDTAEALVNAGDGSGVVAENTVMCMTYTGPDLDAAEFTYEVTVDDDVSNGDTLTNSLVHVTDDPGAEEVTVSRDVTVEGAQEDAAVSVRKVRDAKEPRRKGILSFRRPASTVGERLVVDYDVAGNARPGRDYRRLDGRVTFKPNQRTTRELVKPLNRRGRQSVKRVVVRIVNGDGYTAGQPRVARVRILDKKARG
jgi:uncharacterized repeat protein (TIGR01451 family)